MSSNPHGPGSNAPAPNRNNRMPGNPGDARKTEAERPPATDEQGQSNVEAFDEEGAGIAAKE